MCVCVGGGGGGAQTCQVSRILRETHAFTCHLTLTRMHIQISRICTERVTVNFGSLFTLKHYVVSISLTSLSGLETKNFLTKITNDLVMATPIDSRKSRQTRNAINQPQSHPLKNVEFRDGMGLRLVNGIPCLSAFSGVDRGGHH